jgi:hypothetical protein
MKWPDTAAAEVTAAMEEAAAVVAEAVVDTAIQTALPWVADAGGKSGMLTWEKMLLHVGRRVNRFSVPFLLLMAHNL